MGDCAGFADFGLALRAGFVAISPELFSVGGAVVEVKDDAVAGCDAGFIAASAGDGVESPAD